MAFPEAIRTQLAGRKVRVATLVEFSFASGPKRVWNGSRKLTTNDGRVWDGLYGLGSIEGVKQTINGSAPETRFVVSGVDAGFAAAVKAEAAEYLNRPVRTFFQFFDTRWKPLDLPLAIGFSRMRSIVVRRRWVDGRIERTLKLTAETPFGENKRRPRYAYCTDRDQRRRWSAYSPPDRGMSGTAGLEVKSVNFPDVGGDG